MALRQSSMPVHVPVYWLPGDGADPECMRCGREVYRDPSGTVRHKGEAIAPFVPEPADSAAFARACEVVEAALGGVPDTATDREVARAAIIALYRDGMLRRTRKR